jgi:hypothetical protein
MLEQLEAVEQYNNQGSLLGLDGPESEELLGALKKMNPLMRMKWVQKLTSHPIASKGSRGEMEKHFSELPQMIKDQLKNGELRLADTIIYTIKPIASKTIKMFEPQDKRQIGLISTSEGRLTKNSVMLVSGIILLAGVAASAGVDDVMATKFDHVEAIPALANGEFYLKANKKIVVPEGTGNRVFCTDNFHGTSLGYYKLANPRLILDDVPIELNIDIGTMTGIAANSQIFVGLHGTITTP